MNEEIAEKKVITLQDFDTKGVNPSDLEPLDYFNALSRRVGQIEKLYAMFRIRMVNMETELGMRIETLNKLEKKIESLEKAIRKQKNKDAKSV